MSGRKFDLIDYNTTFENMDFSSPPQSPKHAKQQHAQILEEVVEVKTESAPRRELSRPYCTDYTNVLVPGSPPWAYRVREKPTVVASKTASYAAPLTRSLTYDDYEAVDYTIPDSPVRGAKPSGCSDAALLPLQLPHHCVSLDLPRSSGPQCTDHACSTVIEGAMHKDTYVSVSHIPHAGNGLFSHSDIPANSVIGNYGGVLLCYNCYTHKYVHNYKNACRYVLCVDPLEDNEYSYFIDASIHTSAHGLARFINHAPPSKANVAFVSVGMCNDGTALVQIVSLCDIYIGNEILCTYMNRWKKC